MTRVVRDLDEGGGCSGSRLEDRGGARTLQVPEVLQSHLLAIAEGKLPRQALRPSLAGLGQEVGEADLPDGRGAEGDCARDAGAALDARLENGVSAHVVAASLGHESFSTTMQSYVRPEAREEPGSNG